MLLNVRLICVSALVLAPAVAQAQREITRNALLRFEETMSLRREEGAREVKELLPAIVISVTPAFEQTRAWYPTAALASLVHVFGAPSLRSCEACMAPHAYIANGRFEQSSTALTAAEITRLDALARGKSAPARIAIWLDETTEGVSLKVIDLQNSRIVMAQNFDPSLSEQARTTKGQTFAEELDRRQRGDSLTHTFIDVALYPGQHISLDWAEQWGDTNANLSGVSLSLFDPVLGVGAEYFRVIPQALNLMVGAKVLLSVPTALIQAIAGSRGQVPTLFDPIITGVFMVRLPIASSNYGVILSVSTNGRVGLGFSLMNLSLLPFLP